MLDQMIREVLEEAASEVPSERNLFPSISARIEVRSRSRLRMKSYRHTLALGSLLLLLLAISLGRQTAALARIGEGIQSFGLALLSPTEVVREESRTLSLTPGPMPSGTPVYLADGLGLSYSPGTGLAVVPSLSVEEAQHRVGFAVRTPSWLPDGLVFRGALAESSNVSVLSYKPATKSSSGLGGLFIQQARDADLSSYSVSAASAQEVRVHDLPGVYVRGSWERQTDSGIRWNESADAGILSWQDGEYTYVLSYSELQLSREDLIRVAESLR